MPEKIVKSLRTSDVGNVSVKLTSAARVLYLLAGTLEALIAKLGVPLGGGSVLHGARGSRRGAASEALLRGKLGEGGARAGLAARHAVAVALVSRVLEGLLLAGSAAREALDQLPRRPIATATTVASKVSTLYIFYFCHYTLCLDLRAH